MPTRLALLLAALLLAACAPRATAPPDAGGLRLRILHLNDHHSRLGVERLLLRVDGRPIEATGGSFPLAAALIRERAAAGGATLKLHAGDALTGDLFFTLFRGEADADLMNAVCFDAFVVGNHEFDHGDAGLRRFLDWLLAPSAGCRTAVLGANVRPRPGVSPLAPAAGPPLIAPTAILEREGVRIGVVGILAAGKTRHASRPDPGTEILDEAGTARAEIERLRAAGIEHVVLLTHVGLAMDLALARSLPAVDAIVGGDSHTLLGEGLADLGLRPAGPYPIVVANAEGDRVCVAHAWQYALAVGELEVEFDARGRVRRCGGRTWIPIDGRLRVAGGELAAAEREAVLARLARLGVVALTPDPEAQSRLEAYERRLEPLAAEVVATVPETLCARRLPGRFDRARDGTAGCAELTDAHGGHVQQLVAWALLEQARAHGGADIAIQNGGGVRSGIPAGALTVRGAYTVLPFANTLVRLRMSGREIREVLEEAVDFLLSDPLSYSGSFPYAAGLRWSVDLGRPAGERFADLEVLIDGGWRPLEQDRLYRVVTNDFLAGGEDGYRGFARIPAERREALGLEYAEALIAFARARGELRRPAAEEMSTRRFRGPGP